MILPLAAETRHLFGTAQFAKNEIVRHFINAGRGPVVDENALIAALQTVKYICGRSPDVFEHEPLIRGFPCTNVMQPSSRGAAYWLGGMRRVTT